MKHTHIKATLILFLAFWTTVSLAKGIGSQRQLWEQRSDAEKRGFLLGLCEGLKHYASNPLVENVFCSDFRGPGKVAPRFCGALHDAKGKKALQFFDQFYKDADHSDVPNVYAIAAFNDQACGENKSEQAIKNSQAIGKCHRQLYQLVDENQEESVIAAKKAECVKVRGK
jgi:hypothetical protein